MAYNARQDNEKAHYEAMGEAQGLLHKPIKDARKVPWQLFDVIGGFFWPTAVFAFNYWCCAFEPRHKNFTNAICCGPVLSMVVCLILADMAYQRKCDGRPSKYVAVVSACMFMAVVAAGILGDRTYGQYTFNYYTYVDMADYTNVDPSTDKGQTYMDAGIIYFKEYSQIAIREATALQSGRVYCVAPIVRLPIENQQGPEAVEMLGPLQAPASDTFDFWAVGEDCCAASSGEGFNCGGHTADNAARTGLRVLRQDTRAFYMMAVKEWTAKLNLPAKHPIFVTWVRDPLAEIDRFYWVARSTFLQHLTAFAFFNLMLVLSLHSYMFKNGHH